MGIRRAAAVIGAVLMTVLCAVSCAGPENEGASPEAPADGSVLTESALSKYIVIRSDEADEVLTRCGMAVREAFEEAGCPVRLTTDFYREGLTTFTIEDEEILVGETNRPETAEFLEGLAPWQWGYALVGTKIVIAGHDDEGTRNAVDAFCEKILRRAPLSYSSADDYIFGDIPEGEGRIYSLLAADLPGGADRERLAALIGERQPEVVLVRGEDAGEAPEGYAVGADAGTGTSRVRVWYLESAYTYSSRGSLPLLNYPNLSEEERAPLVYSVLRCRDTGEKLVFASAPLPPDTSFGTRFGGTSGFLGNTGDIPAVLFGTGLGLNGRRVSTEETFIRAGYASAIRVAGETGGEENPDAALFLPYARLSASRLITEEGGILYLEFQKTKS